MAKKRKQTSRKPRVAKTKPAQPKSPAAETGLNGIAGQSNPTTVQLEHHQLTFSGPLPPPEILECYDRLTPGFAERILVMAEKEQKHRHSCEDKALAQELDNHKARNKEVERGQRLGLLIGLAAIGCGTWLAYAGNPWPGGFIGTGGVIGLVAAFLFSHRRKQTSQSQSSESSIS